MPHLDIRVSKMLDAEKKHELQKEIGSVMRLIPGKTISNTVISITDRCSMFNDGEAIEGAFVDVRLYKESPGDSKKAFSEKLFAILETKLGIPPDRVQMNFIELPNWASSGSYK